MCDVCKSEGLDYRFKNGSKAFLTTDNLYKVFKNSVAVIKLCHIHSIELFMVGERRFLRKHLSFARVLAKRSRTMSQLEESPFGL